MEKLLTMGILCVLGIIVFFALLAAGLAAYKEHLIKKDIFKRIRGRKRTVKINND